MPVDQIINCKGPDCDQVFVNPCQDIVSLLSLINSELSGTRSSLAVRNLKIEKEELLKKGIIEIAEMSITLDDKNEATAKVKVLTLRCSKGHRYQYTVDCK